jgi:hypothetical protein
VATSLLHVPLVAGVRGEDASPLFLLSLRLHRTVPGNSRISPRAAARNAGKWVGLDQLFLPFPSLPVVTPTVTCKRRKKNTGSRFYLVIFLDLFKTFSSLFLPVRFSTADGRSSNGGLLRPLLGCC